MAKTKLQFNLEGSVPIILRKDFSRIKRVINTPNLLEVQRKSYERFLQKDIPQDKRANNGLQGVFKSVFPIEGLSKNFSLEFMGYTIGEPKYSIFECKQKGLTYSASLKVLFDLVTFELDPDLNGKNVQREIKDIKEQEVYFGEIPLMTQNGSFIINGIERVIVSQLQRSPGVFYDNDKLNCNFVFAIYDLNSRLNSLKYNIFYLFNRNFSANFFKLCSHFIGFFLINGISLRGSILETTPLFPCLPAILSPTDNLLLIAI